MFLSLIVQLSLLSYVSGLGFYSDDWAFMSGLSNSVDQSLFGLFENIYYPHVYMRPVQIFYLAGLYWLFGLDPLGYHLVNAAVFNAVILLFYFTLRELGLPRLLIPSVPLVYGLLPHYSTDRFWVAAFQINLSMALYFLSFYAGLRALYARAWAQIGWLSLNLISLLGSVLAYEVALPLFLFNLFLIRYRQRQLRCSLPERRLRRVVSVLVGSTLLSLTCATVFKALTTARYEDRGGLWERIWLIFSSTLRAVNASYHEYGVRLPFIAWKALSNYPNARITVAGVFFGLITAAYLYRSADVTEFELPSRIKAVWLIATGLVVFGLGYLVLFATNFFVGFADTGINNRMAMAAAAGVALSVVGVMAWITTLLRCEQWRRHCFCLSVAFLCTCGFLINNTLGTFWAKAYRQEMEIIDDIRTQFPTLPAETTLILDGVCPYVGPAIVFDCYWDTGGILKTYYHDLTLQADVVTPRMKVGEEGLTTRVYHQKRFYPYNEKLIIYHTGRKLAVRLSDAETARRYFQSITPDLSNGCPPGKAGYGVRVF